jgi:hypothetical protein
MVGIIPLQQRWSSSCQLFLGEMLALWRCRRCVLLAYTLPVAATIAIRAINLRLGALSFAGACMDGVSSSSGNSNC